MPRIFDHIEQELLPALRQTLGLSRRSDFCAGYSNLGWKAIDGMVDQWSDIPATRKQVEVERRLSERGMEAHKRIRLPKKSVCVVCMTEQPSISNQQINSIIPTNGEYDPDFVYYLSTTLRNSLVAFAGGAATPIINKSTFSSIRLLLPEFDTQRKIGALLSAYDELIETNKRRIVLLEKLGEEIYREWFVRHRFPGHEKAKKFKGVPDGWRDQKFGQVCQLQRGYDLTDANVEPAKCPDPSGRCLETSGWRAGRFRSGGALQ